MIRLIMAGFQHVTLLGLDNQTLLTRWELAVLKKVKLEKCRLVRGQMDSRGHECANKNDEVIVNQENCVRGKLTGTAFKVKVKTRGI